MTRTAVVIGGTSGIGKRTVERLVDDGWTVWSLGRSAQRLDQHRKELDVADHYRSAICDVEDPTSICRAFAAIGAETDSIDALICSAGVNIPGSMEEMTAAQATTLVNVNFLGPWLCVQHALPLLRRHATVADPARVVIVGSIGGMRPKVGAGIYSATKAAVHVLVGVMAVELAPSGVIVNAVAPGSTNTPMVTEAARSVGKANFKLSGPSPLAGWPNRTTSPMSSPSC